MKKLIGTLACIAGLIAAAAIYLGATTPKRAEPLRFPLSEAHRALLARVPASADSFALLPSAALLHQKLAANAVTREALARYEEEHEVPPPWMLGGADIVAWKHGKKTSYVVRLDGFRALIIRVWLTMASNASVRWEGSTLVMNDPVPSPPGDAEDFLHLTSGLPAGDVFLVQRQSAHGAFPPIARPSVTSLRVTDSEIVIASRAQSGDAPPPQPVRAQFPRGAMLSVTFSEAPRILGDLNRLMGARIDELVDPGGSIALYDIETGTLLPRPRGVIVVPSTEQTRAAMTNVVRVAEVVGEVRETGGQILVSFDRTSLGLYLKDTFVPPTWTGARWALRIDPSRLVPVIRKLNDSVGLRLAAPRIHRSVRDLHRWIDALDRAQSIEAASSVDGGVEELRVRIEAVGGTQ
jgi:hypothetical protein